MVKKAQHDRNKRQIKNLKRENKNTKDALEILKKAVENRESNDKYPNLLKKINRSEE